MGAELCLAIADAPPAGMTSRGHALDVLHKAVANLSDDTRALIEDQIFGGEEVTGQELCERVVQAYDDVTESMRDVVYTVIHGHPVWISGGMTWGDTPTENYDNVLLLDYLQPNWEA